MRTTALIGCVLCALSLTAGSSTVIDGLLQRVLPYDHDRIEYVIDESTDSPGRFTLGCDGRKVHISGDSPLSVAKGLNHYLNHHAGVNICWNMMAGRLPERLEEFPAYSRSASVPLRYYLNFCTQSYSMAFWDWERWEKELDLMALHGINMPLVTVGFENVWQTMLRNQGFGDKEIASFLPGPAYFGWFYMNNLTGWGGPLPESWMEERHELARKVFMRMGEYGMTPVVPGYSGMTPEGSDQGMWCGFKRPGLTVDYDELVSNAADYYAAVDTLYGDVLHTRYFAIDPFHEGGSLPEGLDPVLYVKKLWEGLRRYSPHGVWVVQHWQDNPKTFLTHTIPGDCLIILDLHGDSRCDTVCGGNSTDGTGRPHLWVWNSLNNYGGNVGLFGRISAILGSAQEAMADREHNRLAGIGAIPEGIENNPMLFDLLYELPWLDRPLALDEWLGIYAAARYGVKAGSHEHGVAKSMWRTLADGILDCRATAQQGCTESVLMMRPAAMPGSVSSWASSTWYWNKDSLLNAAYRLLSLAPRLGDSPNYLYDLVDITRQCVADRAHTVLSRYADADSCGRRRLGKEFMCLLGLQDSLLATVADFRVGRCIEQARSLGNSPEEKDLYERNARMLITTWGDRVQADEGGLHDYANRETNGLLRYYYAPRWQYFFDNAGTDTDWFGRFEWPFVTGETTPYGSLGADPEGDPVERVAVALKYLRDN